MLRGGPKASARPENDRTFRAACPMTNADLIESFKENERDLLKFLVARLKSAFTAQDIAQEVYLKISTLDDTVAVRNARAYLFRMAANLAIDHLRRESRRAELQSEFLAIMGEEAHAATPEQDLISREELARLERALAEMPAISRKIFYLSRFEHRTQREIAAIVGLSPTAVFNHIRRVIDHLAAVRDS